MWTSEQRESRIGANNPNARFTDEEVLQIKSLLAQGISQSQIARERQCAVTTIHRIKHTKSYSETGKSPQEIAEKRRIRREERQINELCVYWLGC